MFMGVCHIFTEACGQPISQENMDIKKDDFIIAADSGWFHAKISGVKPDLLIGDFDSFPGMERLQEREAFEILRLEVDKDETDTYAGVREALERGYKNIVVYGGMNWRVDHTYSNFFIFKMVKNQGGTCIFKDGMQSVFYVENESKHFKGHKGQTVSILPFGGSAKGVSLTGFQYGLENAVLKSDFPIGTSNVLVEDKGIVTVSEGGVLVIQIL